jgi:hypothetical protein
LARPEPPPVGDDCHPLEELTHDEVYRKKQQLRDAAHDQKSTEVAALWREIRDVRLRVDQLMDRVATIMTPTDIQ